VSIVTVSTFAPFFDWQDLLGRLDPPLIERMNDVRARLQAEAHTDALAASAFAKSRDCFMAIQLDILHNIKPMERVGFQRLVDAIEIRKIFIQEMVDELDVQIDALSPHIEGGTTVLSHVDYDECNVSAPACWNEARRTQQAQ
jgi:hypothetical protein